MLIFNLWHKKEKKKRRGYKTIHTFTKRIEDKTNDDDYNNNNINNNESQPLQWPTRVCLNWLVRTGRYTVWSDKSPKATVASFIVQIQVAGLAYWLP